MSISTGPIFAAINPLGPIAAKADADRATREQNGDQYASVYADGKVYKQLYGTALKRLSKPDMLTLAQAAAKLSVTPAEYKAKADAGQAILIEIEGRQVVPAWQFDAGGQIDALKLDIAREFAQGSYDYFTFMHYINFMTETTTDIADTILAKSLKKMFDQAGLQDFRCNLQVNATMNQLADGRHVNPALFKPLFQELESALTYGGWDSECRMSDAFYARYAAAAGRKPRAATPPPAPNIP